MKIIANGLLFCTFILVCNLIFTDLANAVLITTRLFLALLAAYCLSQALDYSQISQGLAWIISPLKIFKINTRHLGLIIALALNFIPILTHEAKNCALALQARGFNFNLKNILLKPQVIVISYLRLVLLRAESLEKTLYSKGLDD